MFKKVLVLTTVLCAFAYGESAVNHSKNLVPQGEYILKSEKHLVNDIPVFNKDKELNIIIEIPAGTNGKWEVNKETGNLDWEFKKGKPRVVQYLPYVGNYGMIPQTLSPEQEGGDGDPLDVILLGETRVRGEVANGKLIGVMLMKDHGETDDKLLAVAEGSVFEDVESVSELKEKYPGVLEILQTWFTNYKGPGEDMKIEGFLNKKEAEKILKTAVKDYKKYSK